MKRSINNIPEGYKRNSTLGVIPNEWEVKRLGEMCNYINSGKNKKKNNNGIYPVYGSTGIIGYTNDYVYKSPLLLVARVGAHAGFTYFVREKCDISDNTLILQLKPSYDLIFAYNQLKNYNLNRLVFGSGQPLITAKLLKLLEIAIPPLPEQRKIAEVLSTWDKAIEKQTLLVEKLELRKKGLMQQLLTGKKRLPGFNGKWEKEKLGKLFDERNETKMPSLPLLSITADKGVISQTESEKKDTSNEDKSKYKRICPGDIGYNTMRMWQGRCALSKLEGIVSPAYTIVSPHNDVNPFYMEMLFKQPFMVYRFWTHSQGLVNDTLNCKYPAFSQVKVTIPEIEEQNAIAEILSFCDKEIALAKQKLDTLRQQKKGLMQVLLTGKKRI